MSARGGNDRLSEAARRLMARLDALAAFSDEPGRLTRLYLTPAHRHACDALAGWMREAGLEPEIDAAGNVRARYPGRDPNAPALMIGSHIDTVRDAGRYDGNLGALAALSIVEALAGERQDFPIDIVAFGDEEGVRFPVTMTGSRALAGRLAENALDLADRDGITLRAALKDFGGDPERIYQLKTRDLFAFVELHIEQGPVLEAEGLAVGAVSAINGAARGRIHVTGAAGHAGSTPMHLRHDALAAAAEMIVAIEARAAGEPGLVATVGQIEATPGAVNVIAGNVTFSLDLRAPQDAARRRALSDIERAAHEIAARRGVNVELTLTHEAPAFACDARLTAGLEAAMGAEGQRAFRLPSGAGHDAMIIGQLCPAAMLFLRCAGGVSHNPREAISERDAEVALRVLLRFVRALNAP